MVKVANIFKMRKTTREGGRNKTVHKHLETTNVHHGDRHF